MLRFRSVPLAAIPVLLLGCSATRVESEHFGASAAIERAMERHYERNATEGNCYHPYIDGFTHLTIREDTPDRLVVHARHLYRDRFQDGGDDDRSTGVCSGFGERTFTLMRSREGDDLIVAMTGEQEESALGALFRRLLPN